MALIKTDEKAKPLELELYELIRQRKTLTKQEQLYCLNLEKGYEGELLFTSFTTQVNGDFLLLTNLLFENHQTTFQIDSLLITRGQIYLYEIKNYEGTFYFEGDKFYKSSNREIVNPLHQLQRAESLLGQLLKQLGFSLPIHGFVVFVHPSFALYQAPLGMPLIFPNQIQWHLQQVSDQTGNLDPLSKRLAAKLLEVNKDSSRHQRLPNYTYDELRKGITCAKCGLLGVVILERKCVCTSCGHKENKRDAVLRSVKDFIKLFPETKITTKQIWDWCGHVLSKKIIWRVLSENYKAVGEKKTRYYV